MSEPILVPASLAKHWENEARHAWSENARLKAEVERLKEGNEYLGHMHDKEMERSAYLCEQVERLRKAGDELLREWSSGDETDARNFKKGLVLWNEAKEGKQS